MSVFRMLAIYRWFGEYWFLTENKQRRERACARASYSSTWV